MAKASFREKLRYRFDNIMSKGAIALMGWLAILTAILIVVVSVFVWLTHAAPKTSLKELIWMSLMRAIDSGTVAGDQGSALFLLGMFIVTIGGIFILGMLIGLITTGIEAKLESLRKGRSRVIESGHTVILGWSERIFAILTELITANSNQKNSCIVIMGDKDKVEMEDEIRERLGPIGRTNIVCRQGKPINISDLEIVSLETSKSVVIIEESDIEVIKTILAIINNPKRRSNPYHIVASIKDPRNYEVAKLVGRDEVEIVLTDSLISRIVAQTCRQPGLSMVYTELLDFGGDEIYFSNGDNLIGKTFKEAMMMYETSTVLGIFSEGVSKINPPMETIIKKGDQIIAVSEDDDTIIPSGLKDYGINNGAIVQGHSSTVHPEHTLIFGWNERAASIINEMDNYVASGSTVTVAADLPEVQKDIEDNCLPQIKNQTVRFLQVDTADRRVLDQILVDKAFNHIIVLCYTHIDVQEADAITLITLLHLRDIAERSGKQFSIVSEMRDIRNRNLAEVAKANDFIVSDKLVSLLVTQIAENKHLTAVFADIFDADGSEIYVKPAAEYVKLGEQVNFYTLVEAAGARDEVAMGYKIAAEINDPEKSYGIHVNPKKSETIVFGENDGLIVLAEE